VPCQEIFLTRHKKIRAIADTDSYSSIFSVRRMRLITYRVVFNRVRHPFRLYVYDATPEYIMSYYYQTNLRSLRVYIHLF